MTRSIPRLSFNELEKSLQTRLERRVARLNYLGEFFQCFGHQPVALCAFVDFGETAKDQLDGRIVETIALTVSSVCQNDYEKNQHEQLCLKMGLGKSWIRQIEALDPRQVDEQTQSEVAVQKLAIAMATGDRGASVLLEDVVAQFGARQAVAVLMVIGRYIAHSAMVGALALTPPVPSPFSRD